jgi:hypothetical protein
VVVDTSLMLRLVGVHGDAEQIAEVVSDLSRQAPELLRRAVVGQRTLPAGGVGRGDTGGRTVRTAAPALYWLPPEQLAPHRRSSRDQPRAEVIGRPASGGPSG